MGNHLKLAAFLAAFVLLQFAGRITGFIADIAVCILIYWLVRNAISGKR